MFSITEEAEIYVADLFEQQDEKDLGLKVDVEKPGTPVATVTFNFCIKSDLPETYQEFPFVGFSAFIDESNNQYLSDSHVALKIDGTNKKLTITAPNAKGEAPKDDAPLEEKVLFTIVTEVNPSLASHGGFVDLVEITKKNEVVLNFGGGCQGCSSVNMTLKDGVEKQLKGLYPEISAVLDATDHSYKENAYM
ncbi:NfuA family Fe-S biogenesis protein [Pseudothioglobus sp. nBUS_23]|jgi:Fe/S biogenesis protein NfuA|uniref:NfuA family Fe-S biogenesis protein n=1 Tax=Pseudothioglobus sp. nBUS_23 TaxID=3395318 RepID=UPI003EB92A3F|tara:strand:+ start:3639 stop:4217 length:579 start_codon:yes stop_codon:yes gene_type:complete